MTAENLTARAGATAEAARPVAGPERPAPGLSRFVTRRNVGRVIAPIIAFAVLAAVWQIVAHSNRTLIPTIGAVYDSFTARPSLFFNNLWYTLENAMLGYVIGIGFALVLAVLVVRFAVLYMAIMPVAVLMHSVPVLAIAPALIVAFGFGRTPHVLVVALMVFFPMLINAITGLGSVPNDILDVFRAMAAPEREIFLRLRAPNSLPFLFAGAKVSITLSMIGAVVSEFTGSTQGLGAMVITATTYLDLAQMWGAIALAALTSIILLGLVSLAQRLIIRW